MLGFSEFAQELARVVDQKVEGVRLGPEDRDIRITKAILLYF